MDRGAAHDPSILLTWNLRSFGRNPRRSKSVGPSKDLRTNRPSRYTIKSNTNEHTNVGSNHTFANFVLHSNRHSRSNSDSIHNADSAPTVAFTAFENAMALYRRWPRRRRVCLFHIHEMETESGDCRATRVLSAFGLGRSAEATRECVHQIRVIFSSQCICRPGPTRD